VHITGIKDRKTMSHDNWPVKGIVDPGENDVMCGRGGGTNNHVGNIRFRQLVNEHKLRYLAAPKVDKPKVARDVVQIWRAQSPPGRFLTKSSAETASKSKEVLWHDVGDQKAREKASQCLRERTPDVLPFVQHLKNQEVKEKADRSKKVPDRVNSSSDNAVHPDNVQSNTGVDAHLQQLQQLHELQQQQIQQLQLIQQQLASGLDPNQVLSTQDVSQLTHNPAAAAAALVDPRTPNEVATMLRRQSMETNPNDDDSLLNDEASARGIATALFGRQPNQVLSGHQIAVGRKAATDKLHNSAMTLEEYIKTNNVTEDRTEKMDEVSNCSWVQSFQSIDSCSMTSAHSLGKIGGLDNDLNNRQKKMGHAKNVKDSKMSMISELTDYDENPRKSSRSLTSRARKMNEAKNLNSNISMFSELTDMTGDFSALSLRK